MQTSAALPPMVDAETIAAMLEQNGPLTIIDVHTPAEFKAAHIPGSYNVPLDLLPEHRAELRDALRAPALLVCRSGTRARQAAEVLAGLDLPSLHVLDGGISAWEAAGKEIRRGRGPGGAGGAGWPDPGETLALSGRCCRRRPRVLRADGQLCAGHAPLPFALQSRRVVCWGGGGDPPGHSRIGPGDAPPRLHPHGGGQSPWEHAAPEPRAGTATTRNNDQHRERTHSHESTRSFYSPVSCGGPG